jgi:hypothetical protein
MEYKIVQKDRILYTTPEACFQDFLYVLFYGYLYDIPLA